MAAPVRPANRAAGAGGVRPTDGWVRGGEGTVFCTFLLRTRADAVYSTRGCDISRVVQMQR